ncbi:molybdopterin molybdotransferase MoeA [Glutamicibacter sp. AOP38-B1-38]|uniref:molybdopterin molybdotransferase MoeA n=1 Tax=unclassified Glutamicibacter TaxID=2627139 RepID=UPI004034A835
MGISPAEHLAWILDRITLVATRTVGLAEARGTVLAEDVFAAHSLPLWENSAMDGYAVRSCDTSNASWQQPIVLKVMGEVAAGSSWDAPLEPGQAVRIMTGAPIPSRADAVVRVESTIGDQGESTWAEELVRVFKPVQPGQEIRAHGEDLARGALVARAGDQLTAVRLSALAAAGIAKVLVRRAPRVAVLVTGAELQPLGAELTRGQIPESNSLLIGGLLAEAGIVEVSVQHCPDEAAEVTQRLAELGSSYDAIVSTGGVGPGTRDVMRLALADEAEVRAVRLDARPGQPQCTGRLAAGAFVFALPGNPVSAAVGFELFVIPALRAMQGHTVSERPRLTATAGTGWRGFTGKLQVLPVEFEHGQSLRCYPVVHSKRVSHSVGGFGAAQGYALVEPERGDIAEGDSVQVIRMLP